MFIQVPQGFRERCAPNAMLGGHGSSDLRADQALVDVRIRKSRVRRNSPGFFKDWLV
jgi:hypothetical protein